MSRNTKQDPVVAVPRFLARTRSVRQGLELQRGRVHEAARTAPNLLAGEAGEVATFSDAPTVDVWYYVYELGRLRDLCKAVTGWFGEPLFFDALTMVDEAIAHLHAARNQWTHVFDDAYLGWDVNFDRIVRLSPGEVTEYLIDPRYRHHDEFLDCLSTIEAFLRAQIRLQQEVEPLESIDAQIAARKAATQ